MDCSLPGSSVPGILQAGIVEQVSFHSLGDLPTQGSNLGLQHCWQIPYHLSHQESLIFPLYHKLWVVFSCKELMSSTNFLTAIIQGHPTSLASFLDYLRDL